MPRTEVLAPLLPDELAPLFPVGRRDCWRTYVLPRYARSVTIPWDQSTSPGRFSLSSAALGSKRKVRRVVWPLLVIGLAGCAGFMVGRALWGEAARCPAEDRPRVIEQVVLPRWRRLTHAVTARS